MKAGIIVFLIVIYFGFLACNFNNKESEPTTVWDTLEVTASAYNSLSWQTGAGGANITAWGDTLKPGLRAIAVSRDLIKKGLEHNTQVKIEGFDSVFLVKDKMHYRWKNKIDIYMDEDVQKAREFGRKKLKIYYEVPIDSISKNKNTKE
ncbi:3D domain-containing protein [Salegentibacter salegens]|uniref:3D (Asp-Asp-Asp) domain-containing protein n=1 Tax=Salegentibacter salegens TaxID=143223 RepID=A0A1M7IW72_9FLAO|nr:3D domain-containing protein [Salegentibacter salegens]PRX49829.1 3D (Asp-Asp-Asp) domain-containing protein [Salegentibacter salegens]SHM44959.1 3D (Asp-Asp-Asp) domain-containing protein [Salegentibacter salegens]